MKWSSDEAAAFNVIAAAVNAVEYIRGMATYGWEDAEWFHRLADAVDKLDETIIKNAKDWEEGEASVGGLRAGEGAEPCRKRRIDA